MYMHCQSKFKKHVLIYLLNLFTHFGKIESSSKLCNNTKGTMKIMLLVIN